MVFWWLRGFGVWEGKTRRWLLCGCKTLVHPSQQGFRVFYARHNHKIATASKVNCFPALLYQIRACSFLIGYIYVETRGIPNRAAFPIEYFQAQDGGNYLLCKLERVNQHGHGRKTGRSHINVSSNRYRSKIYNIYILYWIIYVTCNAWESERCYLAIKRASIHTL